MSAVPAKIVAGVDIGGTNVRVGVLDLEGKMLGWSEAPIQAERGPEEGLGRIAQLIERTLNQAGQAELAGIGIGASGTVDRQLGAIQNPYTLPTWENVDIVSQLRGRFGVPATIENDADAASLGEYWRGAGQGVDRLYVVTVGTGIGTAFVCDGQLYRGAGGVHPEGGHAPIDPNGPECYCGARGCWESLASGAAIAQDARRRLARLASGDPTPLLALAGGNPEAVDAEKVALAATSGDPLAGDVIERAARYLGLGLVNVISFFFPQRILLGGGIMRSYSLFAPFVQEVIRQHSVMSPVDRVEVAPVQLGVHAGVIGAAYAALKII
ncbi:MAG: ROK family protein [Chloroflexi bacterium]|nr:ROK family protein [Chloroflexota bacterium]